MCKGCTPGTVGIGCVCVRFSELEGKPEHHGRVFRILSICGSGRGIAFDSRRVSENLCRQCCRLGDEVAVSAMDECICSSVGWGLRPVEKPVEILLVNGDGIENGDRSVV